MTWRSEFGPEYGDDAQATRVRERLSRLGFKDRSWKNDESPSFWWGPKGVRVGEGLEVAVFIGHPDPNQRDQDRFIVMLMISGSEIEDWETTNDPREAIAHAVRYVRRLKALKRGR